MNSKETVRPSDAAGGVAAALFGGTSVQAVFNSTATATPNALADGSRRTMLEMLRTGPLTRARRSLALTTPIGEGATIPCSLQS
jgi:hypothetical protein